MSAHAPQRSVEQGFPTTRWSLVRELGETNAEHRLEILSAFCQRYQAALKAHLAHQYRGISEEDREDLVQSYIVDKIICSQLLEHAAESRGRFRNYLKTSLNNYTVDWFRRASTRLHHQCQSIEPWHDGISQSAKHVNCFEVVWAKQVIKDTVQRMQADLEDRGRSQVWTVFEQRFLSPAFHGIEPTAIEDLCEQLNTTTQRVYNLLVTARRNFSKRLREVVGEYVANDADIDEEIKDLMHYLQDEVSTEFT